MKIQFFKPFSKHRIPEKTKNLVRKISNKLKGRNQAFDDKKLIAQSGYFDTEYYLSHNPDVAKAGIDPLLHFLQSGGQEGRNPSEKFHTLFYLDTYKDVSDDGMNPLLHYLLHGKKEKRHIAPKPGKNNLVDERQKKFDFDMQLIGHSGYFDGAYYLKSYPDVKNDNMSALQHYCRFGYKELRNPSTKFQTHFYQTKNMDPDDATNPLAHYLMIGKRKNLACRNVGENAKIRILKNKTNALSKEVVVVIPVFYKTVEAQNIFIQLLASIKKAYPAPMDFLRFIIIDDASPYSSAKSLYQTHSFFQRSDISFHTNKQNEGFVKTINKGFALAGNADVIILNMDTRIFARNFEVMQEVAYRSGNIASVTPLSNNATIASISNWPVGEEIIFDTRHELIAAKIDALKLETPDIELPTGNGFCMYIKRSALNRTGYFNDSIFKSGYGEENDWCQRAIRHGLKNILTTETYVYHKNNVSLSRDKKARLTKENYQKITQLHPGYNKDVRSFIHKDPLAIWRKLIQFKLSEIPRKAHDSQTLAFFLHEDPQNQFGGIEFHHRELIKAIKKQNPNYEIFEFFPDTKVAGDIYCLRYFNTKTHTPIDLWLYEEQLLSIASYLESRIDIIHIRHTKGWSSKVIEWLTKMKNVRKILSLHDFHLFCVNPNLIYTDNTFCRHRANIRECNKCFGKQQVLNREINLQLLASVDHIIANSEATRRIVSGLAKTESISKKIVVLPHFLPYCQAGQKIPTGRTIDKQLVVFLGMPAPIKGINLFLEAVPALRRLGYSPEIWGGKADFSTDIPVVPYRGYEELMHRIRMPYIVILPSVWPETFCHTLFESLFILQAPVVVGPYGNPADFVNQHKTGIVMPDTKAACITESVQAIAARYNDYKMAIQKTIAEVAPDYNIEKYLERYLKLVEAPSANR